jgi:crossover junction endodeoxyribonuclease RuvC
METMQTTILAIDPGYDRCGVALVAGGTLLHSICIVTDKKDSQEKRLAHIYSALESLIAQWQPTSLALETLFFSVNKKTALKVAEARGAILLLAGLYNLTLVELSPQEVKLSMTGSGNADKKAIQKMVALTMKMDLTDKLDDEVDAIALGMAAAQQLKFSHLK